MKAYLLFFISRWRLILGTLLQYLMLTMMGKLPNIPRNFLRNNASYLLVSVDFQVLCTLKRLSCLL